MQAVNETVVGEFEKGDDLLVRVRQLEVDGESFIEIREFVPSSDRYGRGLLIPSTQRQTLLKLLRSV